MGEMQGKGPVTALGQRDVLALLRRAAAARGVAWPSDPGAVREAFGIDVDVADPPGRERVVWATLGKQDGLMAVFSGDRLLGTADRSLAEIAQVQPVSLPELPYFALMVDDRYDELVGVFHREERRRIYVWDGRGLRQVYQGTLLDEQYSHARWENPRGPALWRLVRMRGEITLHDGLLTEKTTVERREAAGRPDAPLPPDRAFRLVGEETRERHLRWNPRLRRFSPT